MTSRDPIVAPAAGEGSGPGVMPQGGASTELKVALLPGDGIGPEVTESAVAVLHAVCSRRGVTVVFDELQAGAGAFLATGTPLDRETLTAVEHADAVFLGAMGLPGVRLADGREITPQIDIREHFGLVGSVRPCRLLPGIRPTVRADHADFVTVRELREGLFAGRNDPPGGDPDTASDRMTITRAASRAVFELAFSLAEERRRRGGRGLVTLFDKANVLRSNALLRRVFDEVAEHHPGLESERLYVDAGAMLMVVDPGRFDVIVTENAFGDIVSELGSGVCGGLGLAPSADVGLAHAVFQPCHGTAPDLAGRDVANPVGAILSAAMMLDWLGVQRADPVLGSASREVVAGVEVVTAAGIATRDVGGRASLSEVTAAVVAAVG